jgi:hypothetical protein
MTPLKDQVSVARRFQRSIRIDTDLHDAQALEGFVCPRSSADVLATMARHVSENGHTAFTWTGPYGTGKSSLAVALASALNGNANRRAQSQRLIGEAVTADLWTALPPKTKGWRILPVVACRGAPAEVFGAALEGGGYVEKQANRRWTDDKVLETLGRIAAHEPRNHGGLVVIVDEMGKLLEGAAHDGHDIFLLQRLAEAASRSERRLLFVGILHQAFDEYAQRLARDVRDEWAKVQGRFVDLVVNTAGDEQLDLLSRAIEARNAPKAFPHALAVAELVRHGRPGASRGLPHVLQRCWPLHPTVACLLGPLSRRRFGQNQRSLFGFLNSAEPFGFQDFLANAGPHDLYMPDRLWDYLRVNLEPAILASPDGHRWSMGVESVERCEAIGGEALHVSLLKTIALLDLFRERSGLVANEQLLALSAPANTPKTKLSGALKQLVAWSFVIYRKHADTYSIFAGSDFDIEDAVAKALPREAAIDLRDLRHIAGLQPILAKRHYHHTGAIRWFDFDLVPLTEIAQSAADARLAGASGRFLLAMPTQGETRPKAKRLCAEVAGKLAPNIVIGLSEHAWHVTELARELVAMNKIYTERPELRGDSVAKREVVARIGDVRGRLEHELQRMCEVAEWYRAGHEPTPCGAAELNILASEIVDSQFPNAPRISNELLNRDQPSSNAVKAQKDLLRRMADGEGKPRFGIEGYPAEGGLCDSILIPSRLYRADRKGVWRFHQPDATDDPSNLAPLWEAGLDLLRGRRNTNVTLEELFALWRQPPYGVKAGLLPVLAVALFLTHRDTLAIYREGVFQSRLTSVEIEQLTSNASLVQFRWLQLTGPTRQILVGLADVVKQFDACGTDVELQPIDVARGLIAVHESLNPWAKRTLRLSPRAQAVSALFRQAADPNKFLFDDIPALLGADGGKASTSAQVKAAVERVREGVQELLDAYPLMLSALEVRMLADLEVSPKRTGKALADLRDRANNIVGLSGDYRLNAFVSRLATFTGDVGDMEGIASLALNKPARDWVDADVDQAKIEIADLAQKFLRAETFARVQGRPNKRHAMAVIVPIQGKPTPYLSEFAVHESDGKDVAALIERVEEALNTADDSRRNVILAALAELSARYMGAPAHRAKQKKRVAG